MSTTHQGPDTSNDNSWEQGMLGFGPEPEAQDVGPEASITPADDITTLPATTPTVDAEYAPIPIAPSDPKESHPQSGNRRRPLVIGGAAAGALALAGGLFFGLHNKADATPQGTTQSQDVTGAKSTSAATTSAQSTPDSKTSPTSIATTDPWQAKLNLVAQQNKANEHYNSMTKDQYIAAFEITGDQVKSAYDLMSLSANRLQMLFNTGGTARRADGVQAMNTVVVAHNGHIPTLEEIKTQYGNMISEQYSGVVDSFVDNPDIKTAYVKAMNITATGHAECYLLAQTNGPEPLTWTVDNVPMDTLTVTAQPESDNAPLTNVQDGTTVTFKYTRKVEGSVTDDWATENNPTYDHITTSDETETWRYKQAPGEATGRWMLVGLSGAVVTTNG